MRRAPQIDGLRMSFALRLVGLRLVHIYGAFRFLRARPCGRLITVPVHPGELLPEPVTDSVLLHAGTTAGHVVEALDE